jgi:hypothetical protein
VRAVILVEVDDAVSVSLSVRKTVAATFEVAPQRPVVVDLAVEDDPHTAVFVRHG